MVQAIENPIAALTSSSSVRTCFTFYIFNQENIYANTEVKIKENKKKQQQEEWNGARVEHSCRIYCCVSIYNQKGGDSLLLYCLTCLCSSIPPTTFRTIDPVSPRRHLGNLQLKDQTQKFFHARIIYFVCVSTQEHVLCSLSTNVNQSK